MQLQLEPFSKAKGHEVSRMLGSSVTREQIGAELRNFIDVTLLRGQGGDVTTSMPLFELGILDSFALFTLICFIEQQFGVTIALESVDEEQFRNIDSIAALIAIRRSAAAGTAVPGRTRC